MGILVLFCTLLSVIASNVEKWEEALPAHVDAKKYAPVFDFGDDGCYPNTAISKEGNMNTGLGSHGNKYRACRRDDFLEHSNTYHRYSTYSAYEYDEYKQVYVANVYTVHFYALYFEKGQLEDGYGSAYRHDFHFVSFWIKNGVLTHGAVPYHGYYVWVDAKDLKYDEYGYPKVVYDKSGVYTHSFRFATDHDIVKNHHKHYVRPDIISWYEIKAPYYGQHALRRLYSSYEFGGTRFPMTDYRFQYEIYLALYYGGDIYPEELTAAIYDSNYYHHSSSSLPDAFHEISVKDAGRCLYVEDDYMHPGQSIQSYDCHSEPSQLFFYDKEYKLLHSRKDMRYCVDIDVLAKGGVVQIQECKHNDHQKVLYTDKGYLKFDYGEFMFTAESAKNEAKIYVDSTEGKDYYSQAFKFEPFKPEKSKYFMLKNSASGKCLDYGDDPVSGKHMGMYDCVGAENQKWWYDKQDKLLRNDKAFEFCVDGSTGATGDGIYLKKCDGGENQQWRMDGDYIVLDKKPEIAMEGFSFNTGNDTQLNNFNSGFEQQWIKEFTSKSSGLSN